MAATGGTQIAGYDNTADDFDLVSGHYYEVSGQTGGHRLQVAHEPGEIVWSLDDDRPTVGFDRIPLRHTERGNATRRGWGRG
ncbi:MAG TPA: hypothetical protein VFO16_17550 [Pseudonocardiaceae bacterium]|nr:hypothetical protein [Pseudonocardiaceae bacterium]